MIPPVEKHFQEGSAETAGPSAPLRFGRDDKERVTVSSRPERICAGAYGDQGAVEKPKVVTLW